MNLRRVWLIGAIAVLLGPAVRWTDFLRTHRIERPASPTENDQPQLAAYWRFLADARRVVPPRVSYTIKAPTADDETQLFMLSQGLFGDCDPRPATYNWQPQSGGGRDAKYVLVYGTADCPADAPLMRPVKGGAVCIR